MSRDPRGVIATKPGPAVSDLGGRGGWALPQVGAVPGGAHDGAPAGQGHLIATSPPMVELLQEIERIARSDAKVLITGESGVGKELVANAIHQLGTRARRAVRAR